MYKILLGLLLFGCSVGATAEPGIYTCEPTNPLYSQLEPFSFDSRDADIQVNWPQLDSGTLTDLSGRRRVVRGDDPARWECRKVADVGEGS